MSSDNRRGLIAHGSLFGLIVVLLALNLALPVTSKDNRKDNKAERIVNERKEAHLTDTQRSRVTTGVGILLIALGAVFLVQQLFGFNWSFAWPIFIIAVGLICFAGMALGGRVAGPLAIPGALITTAGLILFYQNTFDRFQTWAYAWTLLVVAGGVGQVIDGAWRNLPERIRSGRIIIGIGAALFIIGAVFFEFALNFNGLMDTLPRGLGARVFGVLGAVALMALGAFLLLRRRGEKSAQE